MKADDIVRRYEGQKTLRQNVEAMWEWMERFVMPYRADLYGRKSSGEDTIEWRKRDIYDSTAPEAAEALAAKLQANLFSPSVRWFDLAFQDEELNEMEEPKRWLEACAQDIHNCLQQSDFNLDAAESMLDVVGYGTMALVEEDDDTQPGQVDFTAVPISECYFEQGSKGQVLRFYRRLEWTALQIVDKFGDKNLPDEVKQAYENPASAGKKFEVVFCIYERASVPNLNTAKPMAKRAMPYGYKYILVNGRHELGDEGGYPEMPVYIVRWRTTAGSQWGNPPGFKLLSTIMDINEGIEQILEAGGLDLEPPLMTTERGIISQLDRTRGGLTVVARMDEVKELPGRGKADLELLGLDALRQQIRRGFYEDQLELKESPAMTATEVNTRYELMQRLLGPTMGRFKVDWLDPMIYRTFMIRYRAGKLPPPPQIVRERQAEYQVEYMGPLARAQKNEIARNTAGWLGQIGAVAETYPDALDIPDWDKALRAIGINGGVPMEYMAPEKEVRERRKERKAQIEAARRIENIRAAGEAGQAVGAATQALPPDAIPALQGAITNG